VTGPRSHPRRDGSPIAVTAGGSFAIELLAGARTFCAHDERFVTELVAVDANDDVSEIALGSGPRGQIRGTMSRVAAHSSAGSLAFSAKDGPYEGVWYERGTVDGASPSLTLCAAPGYHRRYQWEVGRP